MKKINKQNEVEYLNPIQKDNKRKRKVTVKDCIVVFFPFVIVLSIVIFSVYMFSKQQEIIHRIFPVVQCLDPAGDGLVVSMPVLVDAALQVECLGVAGVIVMGSEVIGGKTDQRVGSMRQIALVYRLSEQQVIMRPVFRREVVGVGMQRVEYCQGAVRPRRQDRLNRGEVHRRAAVASRHHAKPNEP